MLPPHLEVILREGIALQGKGRMADAAAKFERLRAAAPKEFDGWYHGGLNALLAGRAAEGANLLTHALELQPASIPAALSVGLAHVTNGNLPAAESVFLRVAGEQQKLPDVWRYLGMVYEMQGRLEHARMARQNLVTLSPKFAPGWVDYGSTLSLLGSQTEALACFARALALDNTNVRARVGCAMVYLRCHRVPEAMAELRTALQENPGDLLARSFYLMTLNNLPGVSREQMLVEHQEFGRIVPAPEIRCWSNPPDPDRRLRVGFLSRDFCEHSVACFFEPLLDHLDPREFEVVLYYDQTRTDAVSERLRARAATWRIIAGQTDQTLAAAMLADGTDILVDLAGHSASNRLPMLAHRVAPVQITYLGYPNTTGVAAIDYRFVDAVTDPAPEADAFSTEELVRFASTAWAYRPSDHAPAVRPSPSAGGAPVTFGSFNNFGKVTDDMLVVWARILAGAPGSRLLIKAAGLTESAVSEPLRKRLRAAGLADADVELLGHTPDTASHLALYGRVDIALDTFPYNGTTTTCEALWMGVPVVTLVGDRHASRVGCSLLSALGRPEWMATTAEHYVQIAVGLAADVRQLRSIRETLRGAMACSSLLDHSGQAARFAAALRTCWRRWCQRTTGQSAGTPLLELVAP